MNTMYQMQEGSMTLPADWIDKTMNVFVSAATGTEGVSFVVTRERLPWGMQFGEYVASELHKLARQVPGYEAVGGSETQVSGRAAHVHEYKWTNNGSPLQQLLTMVEHGKQVLMLTFTAPGVLSPSQKALVEGVVQSLRLNDPA
ncbi:conserved hypothethical protein (plasmid) [Ralstonia solanacearum CMR15]|nr:conserved hypothethical protein [Ralstonia solanacearum CMR15]